MGSGAALLWITQRSSPPIDRRGKEDAVHMCDIACGVCIHVCHERKFGRLVPSSRATKEPINSSLLKQKRINSSVPTVVATFLESRDALQHPVS